MAYLDVHWRHEDSEAGQVVARASRVRRVCGQHPTAIRRPITDKIFTIFRVFNVPVVPKHADWIFIVFSLQRSAANTLIKTHDSITKSHYRCRFLHCHDASLSTRYLSLMFRYIEWMCVKL